MLIDLSHPLTAGMPVFPGDPEVQIVPALTLAADGVAVASIACGSQSGTHIDAPAHLIPGGRTMDQVSLSELVGAALLLDAANSAPLGEHAALTPADLGLEPYETVPRIVIVRTGWDRYFGEERYLRHPYLTREAAAELWRRGMRVLGVDAPSPDRAVVPDETADLAVHEIVLRGDGLIVENLRNLASLSAHSRVGFFPLPLAGSDGAPVRAVCFGSATAAATAAQTRC